MIQVGPNRFMAADYAAATGTPRYTPSAAETAKAAGRARPAPASIPATARACPVQRRSITAAPLAGVLAPTHMTTHEREAEKARLATWLKSTEGRILSPDQKATAEVLRDRLAYLARGFR